MDEPARAAAGDVGSAGADSRPAVPGRNVRDHVEARTIPVADIPQRVDEDESLIQGVIDFRVRCWKLRGKS
jgi:hypothetical protein